MAAVWHWLRLPSLSVAQAAYEAGFTSPRTLRARFQALLQITPGAARDRLVTEECASLLADRMVLRGTGRDATSVREQFLRRSGH